MTEEKNLTPFSIADILKSNDRERTGGGAAAAVTVDGAGNFDRDEDGRDGHQEKNEALDMSGNGKRLHKKGKRLFLDISDLPIMLSEF